MKRFQPPVWLCALLLALALCWRMVGAPVTLAQFRALQTPFWQARTLLPSRSVRMWKLWLPSASEPAAETMTEEAGEETDAAQDAQMVNVYLTQENRLTRMTLEGYVCGVVAAEMPARYHLEALKAQAVAARTRVLAQMEQGGCSRHPGADICTDSAHCQGYATLGECRQKWQDGYEAYRDRVLQAQRATRGEVLTYDGELITVLYHAISGGQTEDAATVFSQSVPYLVSVESGGEEETSGFWQDDSFSFAEIAQKINQEIHTVHLTAQDVQRSFAISRYTTSGRVEAVQIREQEIAATALRKTLGLRSTWFSISMDDQGITFHQRGYGHGVGMSQAGANSMAANGAAYAQILAHYYPGVMLERHQ